MTPLETGIDPLAFESWVQIAALVIIVTAGLLWRWIGMIGDQQKATGETVEQIKNTLTTNNGGSHIKDQLDRIEDVQRKQAELMAADSQRLSDHLEWSATFVRDTNDRLNQLPWQPRVGTQSHSKSATSDG